MSEADTIRKLDSSESLDLLGSDCCSNYGGDHCRRGVGCVEDAYNKDYVSIYKIPESRKQLTWGFMCDFRTKRRRDHPPPEGLG